jgi:hypothetical protein
VTCTICHTEGQDHATALGCVEYLTGLLATMRADATAAERERCAKVALEWEKGGDLMQKLTAGKIATAIRNG